MTEPQSQTVTTLMKSIYADAEVTQLGPDHYRVSAPLEVIPRLVKARDCMLLPTCAIEFQEPASQRCPAP